MSVAAVALVLCAALGMAAAAGGHTERKTRHRTRHRPSDKRRPDGEPTCPGTFSVDGFGEVALVPTGWLDEGMQQVYVHNDSVLEPHMDARAYFASECTAGTYDHRQYVAMNLLGKSLRYTVDVSGAECGCNVAFYLVSMHQNEEVSECKDYYCDANSVCGIPCAEIDIMEANAYAWHTTLHTQFDHSGMGGGLGGGDGWNGPRDWSVEEFSPGGTCVDTSKPFDVEVSFPVNRYKILTALEITLSQPGRDCKLSLRLSEYAGMADLSKALDDGMTPVVSYWGSDKMLWMDGEGPDGKGPCHVDKPQKCAPTAKMYNFTVSEMAARQGEEGEADEEGIDDSTEGGAGHEDEADFETPTAKPVREARCAGTLDVAGIDSGVHIVPTGWGLPDMADAKANQTHLVTHMGSRVYLADACTAGHYDHKQYMGMQLLGKALRYSVDLSAADCGCNSALYLVSMRQNEQPSDCNDYYCDANSVCGVPCAEIDIQEANLHAWHSTLHSQYDHGGLGAGFGGGAGWTGPRDFTSKQYGPGGSCVDTSKAFNVEATFPEDEAGLLKGLYVTLSQAGHDCRLHANVESYQGMAELSIALRSGMTPVASYWSSEEMLWMDGTGADKKGYCKVDRPAKCGDTVRMYNFSVADLPKHRTGPKKVADEGICEGKWIVHPRCVVEFQYNGKKYTGCTEEGDLSRGWCSHDAEYKGKWSYCEPCEVRVGSEEKAVFAEEEVVVIEDQWNAPEDEEAKVGSEEEPVYPDEEVVVIEDRSEEVDTEVAADAASHEGQAPSPATTTAAATRTTQTQPGVHAPVVVAPFERCGGENWGGPTQCSAGYRCKVVNAWWSHCVPDKKDESEEAKEEKECFDGWKPPQGCVLEFMFNDVEYVGCSFAKNHGIGWCSLDARYIGKWENCTRCDDDGDQHDLVMQNLETPRKSFRESIASSQRPLEVARTWLVGLFLWGVAPCVLVAAAATVLGRRLPRHGGDGLRLLGTCEASPAATAATAAAAAASNPHEALEHAGLLAARQDLLELADARALPGGGRRLACRRDLAP